MRSTYAKAQAENYPAATCRTCYMPCNPHTREFRGTQECPACYDEHLPLLTVKKERHGTVAK